jgi:hypothetical protein
MPYPQADLLSPIPISIDTSATISQAQNASIATRVSDISARNLTIVITRAWPRKKGKCFGLKIQ